MSLTQWHLWTGFWPLCLTCPQWMRKLVPECELWYHVPCSVQLTMFFSKTFFFHKGAAPWFTFWCKLFSSLLQTGVLNSWYGVTLITLTNNRISCLGTRKKLTNRCLSTVEGGQNPCKSLTDLWCYKVPSRQWYKNTNTLPRKWETSCFTLQSPEQKEPEDLVYLRLYIWVHGSDPSTK